MRKEIKKAVNDPVKSLLKKWAYVAPPDVCVVCYKDDCQLFELCIEPESSEVFKLCRSCYELFSNFEKGKKGKKCSLIVQLKDKHSRIKDMEALEAQRLKWFEKICREAHYKYRFEGLADMLEWMWKRADKV